MLGFNNNDAERMKDKNMNIRSITKDRFDIGDAKRMRVKIMKSQGNF